MKIICLVAVGASLACAMVVGLNKPQDPARESAFMATDHAPPMPSMQVPDIVSDYNYGLAPIADWTLDRSTAIAAIPAAGELINTIGNATIARGESPPARRTMHPMTTTAYRAGSPLPKSRSPLAYPLLA